MSSFSRNMLIISLVLTGVVTVSAAIDLFMGIPFGGQTLLDIMFLLGGGMIGYMGFETFKDYS